MSLGVTSHSGPSHGSLPVTVSARTRDFCILETRDSDLKPWPPAAAGCRVYCSGYLNLNRTRSVQKRDDESCSSWIFLLLRRLCRRHCQGIMPDIVSELDSEHTSTWSGWGQVVTVQLESEQTLYSRTVGQVVDLDLRRYTEFDSEHGDCSYASGSGLSSLRDKWVIWRLSPAISAALVPNKFSQNLCHFILHEKKKSSSLLKIYQASKPFWLSNSVSIAVATMSRVAAHFLNRAGRGLQRLSPTQNRPVILVHE